MSKYNIIKNRSKLSPDEISKNMNFDKFMSGYTAPGSNWLTKTTKWYLGATASTVVVLSAAYFAYQQTHKTPQVASEAFVKPPVPELNIRRDSLGINTDRDTTLMLESGTSIDIPAHSFESEDGKPVSGPVKICYREFRDQVDFILSGIPMNYDSAGVHEQLESDGMFEILAYQDGKPVHIMENKNLTINMLCHNTGNEFNVYYLDTVRKTWLYDGPNTAINKHEIDKLNEQREQFVHKYELVDSRKLITPNRANPLRYNFMIDYDKDEFPELAVYDGVKFEIDEQEKTYDPKLASEVWEDVTIGRHNDARHYMVTFKKGKTLKSFAALPVFDEKDYDAAMKEYEKMRTYHQNRLKTISDSIAQREAAYVMQAEQDSKQNSKFSDFITNGAVYRSIVIGNLGIWNHDARRRFFDGQTVNEFAARFVSRKSGETVAVEKVYLIDWGMNAVYPIGTEQFNKFTFSQKVDVLVAVTNDHQITYIKKDKLKEMNFGAKEVTFRLEEPLDGDQDRTYIKNMLRI